MFITIIIISKIILRFSSHRLHTGSGAHQTFYLQIFRSLLGGLEPIMKLVTHFHLVTSSRMSNLRLHSSTKLNGEVL